MKTLMLALAAGLALSACSTVNHSVGSFQLNYQAEPFPDQYREVAASVVSGRRTIEGTDLLLSAPNTMIGRHAFSPMRWYVCVRGIEPRGRPSTRIPLQKKLDDWIDPPLVPGAYDLIVVFEDEQRTQLIEGFDSRLCRDAEFERL